MHAGKATILADATMGIILEVILWPISSLLVCSVLNAVDCAHIRGTNSAHAPNQDDGFTGEMLIDDTYLREQRGLYARAGFTQTGILCPYTRARFTRQVPLPHSCQGFEDNDFVRYR